MVCNVCAYFFHANNERGELGRNQTEIFSSVLDVMWICISCRSNSFSGGGPGTSVSRRVSLYAGHRADNPNTISVGNITEELRILRESVTFCSDKISDFEVMIKNVTDYMKLSDKLKVEKQLKCELSSLSSTLLSVKQTSRNNTIEMVGVPESEIENFIKVVQNIGCFIRYKIESSTN